MWNLEGIATTDPLQGSSLCYCYLQVALQAALSHASCPQYAISDGGWEADWHQSRTVSDDLLTSHFFTEPLVFFRVEICYKERALLFGQGS